MKETIMHLDFEARQARVNQLSDLEWLINYARKSLIDINKRLASEFDTAFYFPSIRQRLVNRKDNLERAIPRLEAYYNGKLEALKFNTVNK